MWNLYFPCVHPGLGGKIVHNFGVFVYKKGAQFPSKSQISPQMLIFLGMDLEVS